MSRPQLRELSIDVVDDPHAPARSTMEPEALEDLARSIRSIGLIQPIVVVHKGDRFEVVAGHRRLLACRMAGLAKVECKIYADSQLAEEAAQLHENIKREDLNPVDQARLFERLLPRVNDDLERLAELLRERRDYVESRLALLTGDADVLRALEVGDISIGVAQELNLYLHQPTRFTHLQLAIQGGAKTATVRSWRKQANEFHQLQQTGERPAPPPADPTPTSTAANPFVCYFCGSDESVESMEQIYIHKPCKGLLKSALGERFRS